MQVDNKSLIIKIQQNDKAAEEVFVKENIKLVHSITRRFIKTNFEYDDLFQCGMIGLIKAARKFDSSFDVEFSTYAVPVIMGEIRRYIRDDGIIKVSRTHKENISKINQAKKELENSLKRSATINEIANMTNLSPDEIIMAYDACSQTLSLDEAKEDDNESNFYKIFGCDDSENILNSISLSEAIKHLDKQEKAIITMRYFRDMTQAQCAKCLNLSQVQVSRSEKRALKKLKEKLK